MLQGYSDLKLESRGCDPGSPGFVAKFRLGTDISPLFPYVNAVAVKPSYFENPHYIKFTFEEFSCALYPDNGVLSLMENQDHAAAAIGRLVAFLNDIESRKALIEPNHKKFKQVPVFGIYKLLPKTNCKECGFPTCMSFAGALGKGDVSMDVCPGLRDGGKEYVVALRGMLFG